MKREIIKLAGLTILASLLTLFCETRQLEIPSGSYQYEGFDADGLLVTEGYITISVDNSLIEGYKNVQIITKSSGNQLDAGMGSIEGRIDEKDSINIRFTYNRGPNMFIIGQYKNGTLSGKRLVETLTGQEEIGSFIAER